MLQPMFSNDFYTAKRAFVILKFLVLSSVLFTCNDTTHLGGNSDSNVTEAGTIEMTKDP